MILTLDENLSLAERFALQDPAERDALFASLADEEIEELEHDWGFWGRPKQQMPTGDWFGWLILAGRGYGKTRTGSEGIKKWVDESWDNPIRIAGIAETKGDARDVMVEGDSGILSVFPDDRKPKYEPSKRRLTWPNGTQMFLFSGDEPDQLRGPQFHKAWVDELAKFKYPDEAWDMLEFGLRLGEHPQVIITTTPRPIPLIKTLVTDPDVVITRGSSYENYNNLAEKYIKRVIKKYEGTRLGRQELLAEILSDAPGAQWTEAILERSRRKRLPQLTRIGIGVDPAVTANEDTSDKTGLIAAGIGVDGHGYVFAEGSAVLTPRGWARRAVTLYDKYGADIMVGEVNNGGDLVEVNIRTIDTKKRVHFKKVRASRGKHVRSAPIASLFEQDRIHILGSMPELEDQLVSFTDSGYIGGGSPDTAEAMIWILTELMLGKSRKYDPDQWETVKR